MCFSRFSLNRQGVVNFFSVPPLSFHFSTSKWLNRVIGVIDSFRGISLISKTIKMIAQICLHRNHPSSPISSNLDDHILEDFPLISDISQRVILVANKKIFMEHCTGKDHPEAPKRVEVIEQALTESNLMNQKNTLIPRQATIKEISLCHSKEYLEELQRQITNIQSQGKEHAPFDNANWKVPRVSGDFQISPNTLIASLYAAGAPLTAIEYILNEENQTSRAFCIDRPPGHHAHKDTGSGFCIVNNVAIAAKHLTQNLGFQRVLIVDWDAHHGDGTQELTEDDEKIFYFSTHMDTSLSYPGNQWGEEDQQGIGKGKGTVLNCPISGSAEECRKEILNAFTDKLIPAMDKYQPDFVLISCGFDAHESDPVAGLGLKDEDYKKLTLICVNIAEKYAKGRIVSVLEGGYNLDAIARAAKVHVEALKSSFQYPQRKGNYFSI